MDFKIRNASQLLQDMLSRMSNTYQKTVGFPVYDMLNAVSRVMESLESHISYLVSSLDVDNLEGDDLTRFVLQHKGIERRPASKATVVLTVTGNGTVPKGALFQTPTGVQFAADETTVVEGSAMITVTAVTGGHSGNVAAGAIVAMPVTIPGIVSVTNTEVATGGYDQESDDDLRDRYYDALQKPATSGNVYHYEQWAKEVVGVGDCKVYPLWQGDNTVQIVIVDANGEVPTPELVKTVQDYIDPDSKGLGLGTAPIGAYCTVTAAEALEINVSLKLVGADTEALRTAVQESIKAYLRDIAFDADYVSYARLSNAVIDTEGVIDYSDLTINGDVKNIVIPDKSVAVLGVVTYVDGTE